MNPNPIRSAQATDTVRPELPLPDVRAKALLLEKEISNAVIGQAHAIRLMVIAIFARGHVLLEGDVGVGKTTLLRAAARALGGAYGRVEGTIDLMPSDLVYHTYLTDDGRPRVEPGPILRNGEALSIFFFNEINRARPQVHSLLLRLMAERTVSAFNREHSFPHVIVFADRNKIEREETFELPAAARDRFMMEISIAAPKDRETNRALAFDPRYHDVDALIGSLAPGVIEYDRINEWSAVLQRQITVSPTLERYVLDLAAALRDPASAGISIPGVEMPRLVAGGVSPRGQSFLIRAARTSAWLQGRTMVLPEDVRGVFRETMSHRIFLTPIYEMRRAEIIERMITLAFEKVPAP